MRGEARQELIDAIFGGLCGTEIRTDSDPYDCAQIIARYLAIYDKMQDYIPLAFSSVPDR